MVVRAPATGLIRGLVALCALTAYSLFITMSREHRTRVPPTSATQLFTPVVPSNTACQCRNLHTCLPNSFKMVPEGQSSKHALELDFVLFKAKYSEIHRIHKTTRDADRPLLRVTMSNFGPD
ncbi:unnamed protein product, partial [marine sediment metagenome]